MNNNLTLVDKINIVDNVWEFKFKSDSPIEWVAGQYIKVKLTHENTDTEGDERYFTISSAPFENIIKITTRVTDSSFKKALAGLNIGDSLAMIKAPSGDFVWQDSQYPVAFIIGGIGITPFISIIKQKVHDGKKLNTILVYNNRTDAVPYKEMIDNWSVLDPTLAVKYEIGTKLDIDKLEQLIPGLKNISTYISGPELMVEAIANQLLEYGLSDQQIKKDHFINYTDINY